MPEIKRTTSDNADFQNLVHLLDTYLKIVDGEDHAFYSQYNKTDTLSNVVLC
ncbi:MAG: GNAT family N-acetyltransferase, partial [Bacteroidia bacterium]|nr:GNAT family N-acetyltransferase [Bacteroidia bacterium]